jgi:hypothetical protein
LVYLYLTGTHPADQVDHTNGRRADDRWANLRAASHRQNCRNKPVRRDSRLGVKGIARLPGGTYAALIRGADGRQRHLGCYSTLQEAIAAYNVAAAELHGEFARPSIDPDNPPVKVQIVRYNSGPLPEPRTTIGPGGEVCDIEFIFDCSVSERDSGRQFP